MFAIFIDGGYLDKILKKIGKPALDFSVLLSKLTEVQGEELLRTYYYNCMPYQGSPPSKEEQERYKKAMGFREALERTPCFEYRLGTIQRIPTESGYQFRQKGVDMMMGIDMVTMSYKRVVDSVVLVTGDSDFVYAIQSVKDAGVKTTLCYSGSQRPNTSLLKTSDMRLDLDEIIEKSVHSG